MPKVCTDVSKQMHEELRKYFPQHTGFSSLMRGVFRKMIALEKEKRNEKEKNL